VETSREECESLKKHVDSMKTVKEEALLKSSPAAEQEIG